MPITWLFDMLPEKLTGQAVLCRLDLNVPLNSDGSIADATRISLSIPTIRYLIDAKAKVVICSHLGRPQGKPCSNLSLLVVADKLQSMLGMEVTFVHDSIGDGIKTLVHNSAPGSVIMLENLRFNSGEEKNDPSFAKMLARCAQVYVNDAFAVCHREHASIVAVTEHFSLKLGGMLLKKEIATLEDLLYRAKHPFVVVVGGAKVESKIGMLTNLLKKADAILLGGQMAFTFLRAQGQDVGNSYVQENKVSLAKTFLKRALELGVKVLLPIDHVVADERKSQSSIKIVDSNEFKKDQIGYDIGPKTIEQFVDVLKTSATVFWNGPLGVSSDENFANGTRKVAECLAKSSCLSVVGGGDSIHSINTLGLAEKINFLSSGGGASLAVLEGKELPGLKALGFYRS